MKNIKQLLAEAFHRELSPEENALLESSLKNDSVLREEKKSLEKTGEILADYSPSFQRGFSERVLTNIFGEEKTEQIIDLYPMFKKILFGGIAAALALLLSVYITDGSLNTDALFGLSDLNSDELLMALMNL